MLYKLQFIDSANFVASSLSNVIENLAEGTCENKYRKCE